MIQYINTDPRRTACCGATHEQVEIGERQFDHPERHDSPTVKAQKDGTYCVECGVKYIPETRVVCSECGKTDRQGHHDDCPHNPKNEV